MKSRLVASELRKQFGEKRHLAIRFSQICFSKFERSYRQDGAWSRVKGRRDEEK